MGRPILTPQEMQAAEQAVIANGLDSFELMQRAGDSVAVLCGPGGNGGDGFVAAAKLSKLWRDVHVYCAVPVADLKGDAARAATLWEGRERRRTWRRGRARGAGPPRRGS